MKLFFHVLLIAQVLSMIALVCANSALKTTGYDLTITVGHEAKMAEYLPLEGADKHELQFASNRAVELSHTRHK